MSFDDVAIYAIGYIFGGYAIGFFLAALVFYILACRVLAVFAESRGHSFNLWFILCFILTPIFAPPLFFFITSKGSPVIRGLRVLFMGFGFTIVYIPYALAVSLISRAIRSPKRR